MILYYLTSKENTKVVYVEERKDLLTEVKELSNNVIDSEVIL